MSGASQITLLQVRTGCFQLPSRTLTEHGNLSTLGPQAKPKVLGAVPPGVVRYLVVVPHDDEWMLTMYFLEIGIGLVLRVAEPVVLERDHLAVGIGDACERGAVAILAVCVLVQVIAEMEHGVEQR